MANVWYRLLEELWVENNRYTAPSEFKQTIARIAPQFTGFGQQDSHELLTFLLDGLHEDLNKVSVKPYKEIEEKGEDEDDEIAAQRFWDLHLLRNDSVIVDLFNGQYRSTITCPECHRVSITYDPYTTVPLPIPKLKKVDVYFVPQFNIKKTIKLSIFISEDALFFDVAHYINSNLDEKIGRFRCMIVSSNECVKMVKASDRIVDSTLRGFIFCCEVNPKLLKSDYTNFVVHIRDGNTKELKSYPRMFTVTSEMKLSDFRVMMYGFMRRFIDLPEKVNAALGGKFEALLEKVANNKPFPYDEFDEIIREEYDLLFGATGDKVDEETRTQISEFISKLPFTLYLINPKNNSKTVLFKSLDSNSTSDRLENLTIDDTNPSSFTIVSSSKFNDDDESLKSVIELVRQGHKIFLEFANDNYINPQKVKSLQTCMSIASKEKIKPLNINDCLEHFRLTEKLEKNNEWYCKDCKKHQQAFKKLELFYTPKLLVLHLKRFEYSAMGRYRTYADKIGTIIDFPLDNLDLSPYIIGPDSSKAIYDLYAVSQHYGSCGGGHYTAICKNNGRWYDFNDSSVSASSESSVVNAAAYLLFYRRRDQNE